MVTAIQTGTRKTSSPIAFLRASPPLFSCHNHKTHFKCIKMTQIEIHIDRKKEEKYEERRKAAGRGEGGAEERSGREAREEEEDEKRRRTEAGDGRCGRNQAPMVVAPPFVEVESHRIFPLPFHLRPREMGTPEIDGFVTPETLSSEGSAPKTKCVSSAVIYRWKKDGSRKCYSTPLVTCVARAAYIEGRAVLS